MKKIFTLLAAFCSIQYAGAQQMSRIVAAQTDKYTGTTWAHYDSTAIMYNTGNYNPGDADSFLAGIGTTLKCDGSLFMLYNAAVYGSYYRHTLTYDAQGYVTAHLWERTSPPLSGTWVNYTRESYTYDANHNVTEDLNENWNSTSTGWDKLNHVVNTYAGNNIMTATTQSWNAVNSAWDNLNQWQYTYNSGQLTIKTIVIWNSTSSAWDNSSKDDFTYFGNGNLQTDLYSLWYKHLNAWRFSSRYTNTWNVANVDSIMLGQDWDTVGGSWRNNWQYRYVFNAQNQVIGDTDETWNSGLSKWVYTQVGTSVNDTSYFRFNWDVPSTSFKNSDRTTTSFNGNHQMTMWKTERWNSGTSAWGITNDQDRRYYYTLVPVGVKDVNNKMSAFTIYPSPASTVIQLNAEWKEAGDCKAAIYDMQGRMLMQWAETKTNHISKTISVADLPGGVYSVLISGKDMQATKQFVIAR